MYNIHMTKQTKGYNKQWSIKYLSNPINRARSNETKKRYMANHPELYRESTSRFQKKIRVLVIEKLGGSCRKCGFTDIRALQIDHIEGGGTKKNKKLDWYKRYKVILNGDSKEVQLLCANCNWIKRYENKELLRKK